MRIAVSWKDGGALLPHAFVMMMIATLVSAEDPLPPKPEGGGNTCSVCAVKEDNYRGPTWAYPCMSGYQGAKPEEVKCKEKNGCFRQLKVINGKKVVGKGGCFDFNRKDCIETVTGQKLNDKGCTPEFEFTPTIFTKLRKECTFDEAGNNIVPTKPSVTAAPARRRRSEDAEAEAEEKELEEPTKSVICVCQGANCNNMAGGVGPRSDNSTAVSIRPLSGIWTGVISGISLVGGSFLVSRKGVA